MTKSMAQTVEILLAYATGGLARASGGHRYQRGRSGADYRSNH